MELLAEYNLVNVALGALAVGIIFGVVVATLYGGTDDG